MTEICFHVTGSVITGADTDAPAVSGSRETVTLRFSFSSDWEGLYKTAILDHASLPYPYLLPLTDDTVAAHQLPPLLPGEWTVGVIGSEVAPVPLTDLPDVGETDAEEYLLACFGDAVGLRQTTPYAAFRVLPGVWREGLIPKDGYDAMVGAVVSAKAEAADSREALEAANERMGAWAESFTAGMEEWGEETREEIEQMEEELVENVEALQESVYGEARAVTTNFPFDTEGKFDNDGNAISGTYRTTGVKELPAGAVSVTYNMQTYNVRGFFLYDAQMNCIYKSQEVSGTVVSSGTVDLSTLETPAKYVAAQVSNGPMQIASAVCEVSSVLHEGGLLNDMSALSAEVEATEISVAGLESGKVSKGGTGEVTAENLQIIENVSKNLFDFNAVQPNKTVNDSTGAIVSQGNIAISGVMAVTDTLPIWSTSSGHINVWAYSAYPEEGSETGVYLGKAGDFYDNNPVTLPEGTAYIIISKPSNPDTYMCYQAREPMAESQPFVVNKIKGEYIPDEKASLAMPGTLYKLKNEPHMVYYDEVRDRDLPVYISPDGNGNIIPDLYQTGKKWVFTQNSDVSGLMARIFDEKEDRVLYQSLFDLKVSDPSTDNGSVTIHPIGDSFTDINLQYGWMNTNLPNLTFVGILKQTATGLCHDGRTGKSLQWMVSAYKETGTGSAAGVSEFMHPVSDTYKYYGTVNYWKYLYAEADRYAKFEDTILRLDIGSNGYRTNPNVNDLMYDGSKFVAWNGTAWATVSEETVGEFAFSYEKYLDVYEIDMPDIVCIQLGTNDWQGKNRQNDMTELRQGFPVWMKTMVDSIHAADASIKVLVIIPPKETMSEAYEIRDFARANANLMECREILVNTFDGLESRNTYLVDAGATIDPYEDFNKRGDNTSPAWARGMISDGIHVNGDGFTKIGKAIGACVQALR